MGPSHSRCLRLAVLLSLLFYLAAVAMLAIMKSTTQLLQRLDVSEMFYGPAITIASMWIISAIAVWAVPGGGGKAARGEGDEERKAPEKRE